LTREANPPSSSVAPAENALIANDAQRLRLLVDGVKDFAIFMMDVDGKVETWNAGAERLAGYKADEIVGANFARLHTPEDIQAAKPRRALAVAEKDGRYEEEIWRVRKDGSRFWANVVITALRDPSGKLFGYGNVTRDVTGHLRATEPFRQALEAAPTGMIMVDSRGRIVLVNAHVEKLFGYPREELVGQPIEVLVPERFRERHRDHRAAFLDDPRSRFLGAGRDLFGLRKDGTEVPVEIGLNPLRTAEGHFVLSSIADITERRRGEREHDRLVDQLRTINAELELRVQGRTAELAANLEEREVLLQEVHHRVKNNLQVISSLIGMQVRALGGDASRKALEECQTRVQAIALIHEKLYQSRDYARVAFSEYARSLAASVFHATGVSPEGITLELAIEDVALAVDRAVPCGLILNELITNALKHAFREGRAGTIRVELKNVEGKALRLAVSDDGAGLPAGLDFEKSPSLGLDLVRMLAKQLDTALEVDRTGGTCFSVTVPLERR